jgi:hypothetical protein
MNEDRILIEVEVDTGKSAEDLANVRSRMDALKDAQKRLKTEMKELQAVQLKNGQMNVEDAKTLAELNRQYADNAAELKQLTAQEKVYTAQIQIATQNDRKYGDSIIELGAQLAQLKQQYRSLSAEQRESEAGKALQKQIADLDAQVKQFDASLGDHQRNVGNYTSALLGLNGNVAKVAELFQTGLTAGLKTAGAALKSFGKTLLTTPVGWILAGVAAVVKVFQQLREAFKRNDEAGTALQVALARFQPILTGIRKLFEGLAKGVAAVVDGLTKAATAVLNLIPAYREASQAAQDLVKAQDDLQQQQRESAVRQAERNKQIAELNKKARSDEKLTAKEKEEIYKQIDELSRQNLEDELKNRQTEYDNYVKWMEQQRKLDDEALDQKNRLYIALIQAQTDYLNETTRAANRESQARQEQEREEEARQKAAQQRWREAKQRRKEAADKELEEMRKLQDLETEMIEDEVERRRKTIDLSYKRQIEDLEKRLKEEKNLTVETYKAIRKEIELLREKNAQEQEDLTVEIVKSENEKLLQETRRLEDINNSLIDDEFERRRDRTEKDYNRQIEDLQHRLDTETDMSIDQQNLITAQIKALQEKRDKDLEEIEKESLRKRYQLSQEEIANSLQERLNAVFGNAAEIAKLELRYAEGAYADLVTMDSKTKKALYGNEEAYRAAVLQAEADMLAAREKSSQAMQQQAKEVADTMQQVTGALSDLFEAAAGDSEAYAKFKKAMAIVDATISLAQTIAAATAISTEGDPYTLAIRIAANVAAVTAQFAAVIKAIKAASIPSAPSFERGGIVPGTSYTGDNVTTRLNSREMVLTLQQQGNLFDLINAGLPRGGIDYRRLAAAFAEGAAQLPAPVLAYSEFKAFERDVRFSEQKMFND